MRDALFRTERGVAANKVAEVGAIYGLLLREARPPVRDWKLMTPAGFRKRFGDQIFLALLKGEPTVESMVEQVHKSHYDSACLFPFMLLAGRHFERELTGPEPESWRSRLLAKGIEVEAVDHGLGMMEGVADLLCDHIRTALDRAASSAS